MKKKKKKKKNILNLEHECVFTISHRNVKRSYFVCV